MESEFEKLLEIDITKGNLSKYMAKIPSLIYFYGLEDNALYDKLDIVKHKLENIEATAKHNIRFKYKRSKITLTEKELRELIVVSDEYDEIKKYESMIRKITKLTRLSKLRLVVLKDKRDMLINIAHNERLEKSSKVK
jgi:hypothetical protein